MDFDNSNFGASELYFYQEESIHIPWEIKEDTISVLGYLCTKANCDFGGRIYTAWFTQDIPINEGPYKFYGLPGMILKIEDSEKLFQFEAIGLEKLENAEIVIDENSRYLKCTKEEYSTIKKRMRENFTEFYREGMSLNYSYRKNGIEYIPIEKI
jgi:GLPGLI family protein